MIKTAGEWTGNEPGVEGRPDLRFERGAGRPTANAGPDLVPGGRGVCSEEGCASGEEWALRERVRGVSFGFGTRVVNREAGGFQGQTGRTDERGEGERG